MLLKIGVFPISLYGLNTEDVGVGTTGEAVLLVDELAANFLVRNIEYGIYQLFLKTPRATAKNVSAAALLFAFDICLLNQFFSSLNAFISSARTFCNFSVGTINRNILISCESRVVP